MPYQNFLNFCLDRHLLSATGINVLFERNTNPTLFTITLHINSYIFDKDYVQLNTYLNMWIDSLEKRKPIADAIKNVASVFDQQPELTQVFLFYCKELLQNPDLPYFPCYHREEKTSFSDTDDIFRVYEPISDFLLIGISPFKQAIRRYFTKIGRQKLLLDHGTKHLRWIRDPIITTSRGITLTGLYRPSGVNDYKLTYEKNYAKYRHLIGKSGSDETMSTAACLTKEELAIIEHYKIHIDSIHSLQIAGGNVIKAINRMGQLKYIVGIAGVIFIMNMVYSDNDHQIPTELTEKQQQRTMLLPQEEQKFYKKFKMIKRIVRNLLIGNPLDPNKQVIFVDQASYHIDLDCVSLGNGVIAVNSYQKFLDTPLPDSVFPVRKYIDYYKMFFTDLKNTYESALNHMSSQLRKHHFDVIRVAGSSENFQTKKIYGLHFLTKYSFIRNYTWYEPFRIFISFCFVNGILIQQSENPNDLDFLIGSSKPNILNPFISFFYNQFIADITAYIPPERVHCIETESSMYEDKALGITTLTAEHYVRAYCGGLRCSVNKIDKNLRNIH